MRVSGFLGAACLTALSVGAAWAESAVGSPDKPHAPTVTIINKTTDVPEAPGVPELPLTPTRPAAAAAPPSPAAPGLVEAPARVQSPAVPARPAAPAAPARPVEAKAPATPAAPAAPSVAAEAEETAPPPEASQQSEGAATAEGATAPQPEAEPTLAISIDLSSQTMTVSEHGEVRYTWPVSSARYGYRTPTGTFRPTWMSKMWYSRQYDYAPMPNAIFFHQGVAIHATYAVGLLGRPASHGCVRLAPKNAALLYKLVGSHTKARTEIVVHGSPVHKGPRVAEYQDGAMVIRRGARYRYLPPAYAQRGYAPAPSYYYAKRNGRYYAMPRRAPRGLYSSGSAYGYGF